MMVLTVMLSALIGFQQAAGQAAVEQQSSTFSVSVDLVKIPLSVVDEQRALIHDLHPRDFRLYEDGIRQEIRSIGIDANPVSAVLLLDTSATVEKELDNIKDAARTFTDALAPKDRISIITFNDRAKLALDWTSDHKAVRKAIGKLRSGGRTALYDAMVMAANSQLGKVEGRRAIILLTDGLNNQSYMTFRQAALAITQSQATLYVVSKTIMMRQEARTQRRVVMLSDIYRRMFGEHDYIEQFFGRIETELTELAESTGGRCYFPADYDQIPGAYADAARDLRSQYFLTYVSNQKKAPNSYHRIELEYIRSSSTLNYRRGYYFEPEPVNFPVRRW